MVRGKSQHGRGCPARDPSPITHAALNLTADARYRLFHFRPDMVRSNAYYQAAEAHYQLSIFYIEHSKFFIIAVTGFWAEKPQRGTRM
jgi:hypothetical protein